MSVPTDRGPDPHADPLVAAVLRAAPAGGPGSCPDAELLALFAERELAGDELGTVEAHVVTCERCQATVAAFVRGAPQDQDVTAAVGGTSAVPWWAGWRGLLPLASAAAVVAVAVWLGRGPAVPLAEPARTANTAPVAGAAPTANGAPADEPATIATPRSAEAVAAPPVGARTLQSRQETREKSLAVPVKEAVAPSPAPAAAPQMADAAATAASPATAVAPALARAENAVGAARAMAADAATLTGTVTYRARIALPAGAVVDVRLLDVSRADAPATTLARAEIVTRGEQVPVPFTLRYDPGEVQPGRRYVVQATIAVDGRVTWRTTTQHPVFADGTAATAPLAVVVDAVR